MYVPKVIVDSNILVSILLGSPRLNKIYMALNNREFRIVICAELLKELAAVLYRPRLKIAPEDIKELFRIIRVNAVRIKLGSPFIHECRDPKDNFILEMALIASADFIVTGDKDLLSLSPFKSIDIITPTQFIQRLKK